MQAGLHKVVDIFTYVHPPMVPRQHNSSLHDASCRSHANGLSVTELMSTSNSQFSLELCTVHPEIVLTAYNVTQCFECFCKGETKLGYYNIHT